MITGAGFALAIFTAFLFTAYALISRILSIKSGNPLAFSVLYGVFSTLFCIPILIIEGGQFQGVGKGILFATFLVTVFYGVFEATQFFVRKYLEASRTAIFFQLTPIITFIVSLAVLHESGSAEKLMGISLIVIGNIVAVYRYGSQITQRVLGLIFLMVASLGLAYVADKVALPHYPIGFYMIVSYFSPALYVIPLVRGNRIAILREEWSIARWRLPVFAVVGVLGYYFLLKTLAITEASVAVPIIFTSTILTALGGIVILGERSNIFQKLCGAILVFAGLIFLSQ